MFYAYIGGARSEIAQINKILFKLEDFFYSFFSCSLTNIQIYFSTGIKTVFKLLKSQSVKTTFQRKKTSVSLYIGHK